MTARRGEVPGTSDYQTREYFRATKLESGEEKRFWYNVHGTQEPLTATKVNGTLSGRFVEVHTEELDWPIFISRTTNLRRA